MKKSYNLKSIMSRAWEIRRAAAAEMGCKVAEVVFGKCLEMAWAETGKDQRNEWTSLPAEKQVNWLTRNVWRASRDLIKYSTADHYRRSAENQSYTLRGHEISEYVNMAWIKVSETFDRVDKINSRRAEKGRAPITLNSIVYNAAKSAYQQILDQDIWYSRDGDDYEISDGDGNTISIMDTVPATDDTEAEAVTQADIDAFMETLDDKSRLILEMLLEGKTERGIADVVGISNVAVHKRIVKMRGQLEKQLRTA